ncbi:MAG: hypothetical protein LBR47_04175 [Spirochaetaceae bacterium]|jgi:hypothetical protein|nr:hypothetical protein [Spirochaetaceae bacterium]
MHEQTRRNAGYLVGLSVLARLAEQLSWNEAQFEAARAELAGRLAPTLAEI